MFAAVQSAPWAVVRRVDCRFFDFRRADWRFFAAWQRFHWAVGWFLWCLRCWLFRSSNISQRRWTGWRSAADAHRCNGRKKYGNAIRTNEKTKGKSRFFGICFERLRIVVKDMCLRYDMGDICRSVYTLTEIGAAEKMMLLPKIARLRILLKPFTRKNGLIIFRMPLVLQYLSFCIKLRARIT